MKNIFPIGFFLLFIGCNSEPNSDLIIKNLQPSDSQAIQFNPAHEPKNTDSSNCKNVENEIGVGEECILKNTTIQKEYLNLINENKIDGIHNLSDTLYNENKAFAINDEGLISSEFKWEGKDKLIIILSYDGGVTEIDFIQNGKNLKRAIYYSGD
ncbi:MAG: hypothetical protein H7329_02040 [Opitutaceae bacterium]|nr:hypothetical protein [Cytophagales bacterium]